MDTTACGELLFSSESANARDIFNLRLTNLGPRGNPVLRSVCPMTAQATPASGRDGSGFPRPRIGSYGTAGSGASDVFDGARPRPGESDPSRMLSGVLVLVIATVIMALALAWWLA